MLLETRHIGRYFLGNQQAFVHLSLKPFGFADQIPNNLLVTLHIPILSLRSLNPVNCDSSADVKPSVSAIALNKPSSIPSAQNLEAPEISSGSISGLSVYSLIQLMEN